MKRLRLFVLLLVSLAVPAYGWAAVRLALPCPMGSGALHAVLSPTQERASPLADSAQPADHATKCRHGASACPEDGLAGPACNTGQCCHPAALMPPVAATPPEAPPCAQGVAGLDGVPRTEPQPTALWRPPRG